MRAYLLLHFYNIFMQNPRSARAQRSLGLWNLHKAERASALSLPAKDFYLAAIAAFEL